MIMMSSAYEGQKPEACWGEDDLAKEQVIKITTQHLWLANDLKIQSSC